MSDKRKVVVLTELVSPYRMPVFNEIAVDSGLDFKVIFLAETVTERKWRVNKDEMKFSYRISRGIGIPMPQRFPIFFNPGLFQTLCSIKPDIVVCGGYQHPSFLLAVIYSVLFRKKLILWCESHLSSIRAKHTLAMYYRKLFVKLASGYLVPGKQSFEFLHQLGADKRQIFIAPNAVDNDFFYRASQEFYPQKDRLKEKMGLPKRLILYVGRLTHSKGIQVLLEAYALIVAKSEVGLMLVGEGPEEKHYRKFCRERNLDRVFFEGFKQQDELPLYYGIADLFVLPSLRDEWGLVLNEAMACGLPVIASDKAGAAHDLVQNGVNGYCFRSGDRKELSRLLEKMIGDGALLAKMGASSREIISAYSPRHCADGFRRSFFSDHIGNGHSSNRKVMNASPPDRKEEKAVLPLISVIMPSYNQARFIEQAIESVLTQNHARIECIVVDAGSTDETHAILDKYRAKLTVVSLPGMKQSEVMNKGLELSRGEIVAFLNADDRYLVDTCQVIAQRFCERPDLDMIYGNFHIIDEDESKILTLREIDFHKPSYLFLSRFIPYPTVFFRRRVYLQVGKFDTALDHAMDYDYWLRVARFGKIEHIPTVLASFRWHSKSKSVIYEQAARDEVRMIRDRYLRKYISNAYLRMMYCAFFWVFYKTRRILFKLLQGRYWLSPPQPFVFYLWKSRCLRQRNKKEIKNGRKNANAGD